MRQTKFRVWIFEKKEWAYYVSFYGDGSWMVETEDGLLFTNFDEVELNQFTGLYDKNGKEIYEGDICKYFDNDAHIVEWVDKEARFLLNTQKTYLPYLLFDSKIEIIGNIYENPDLIVDTEANEYPEGCKKCCS